MTTLRDCWTRYVVVLNGMDHNLSIEERKAVRVATEALSQMITLADRLGITIDEGDLLLETPEKDWKKKCQ